MMRERKDQPQNSRTTRTYERREERGERRDGIQPEASGGETAVRHDPPPPPDRRLQLETAKHRSALSNLAACVGMYSYMWMNLVMATPSIIHLFDTLHVCEKEKKAPILARSPV